MNKFLWLIVVLLSVLIILTGCKEKLAIPNIISFSYTWYFSDGSLFETWAKTVSLWSGEISYFMEEALMNSEWDKDIEINVSPKNAYGPLYDSWKLQKINKFIFDKIVTWFVIWEKKKVFDVEWVIKWIETMEVSEYVVFEMNPRQTWDDLKYNIHILNK